MVVMKKSTSKYSKMTLTKFIRALFTKGTPTYIKGMVGLAVVYTLFPIDFLPDILGPIGLVDDAAVIGLLTTIAITLLMLDHGCDFKMLLSVSWRLPHSSLQVLQSTGVQSVLSILPPSLLLKTVLKLYF